MNIIFFGTPDFAVPSLKILHESDHKVAAVVTAPDKERGRGRKVSATPIKEFAVGNHIPVLQPDSLKDENFIKELKDYSADLFVIVAFKILPRDVFTIPTEGSFNLHGSLLPKYRGAAPIQWALINGETETGLTTFFLEEKVDTGNILLKKEVKIDPADDLGSLHDKMSVAGADLVLQTVNLIESGQYKLLEQDNNLATPAPKIQKEHCRIEWDFPAEKIHNLVRGLSPQPGAFFVHENKLYKVYITKVIEDNNLTTGKIRETKTEIFVGCGQGSIQILELQPEGRRRMKTEEFLRGYSLLK